MRGWCHSGRRWAPILTRTFIDYELNDVKRFLLNIWNFKLWEGEEYKLAWKRLEEGMFLVRSFY